MDSRGPAGRVRALLVAVASAGVVLAASPAVAFAHGIPTPEPEPIPRWLFAISAAVVLVLSFVALATLWPRPKLEGAGWRPLPEPLGRVLGSRALELAAGALGAALLALVVWSGFDGTQSVSDNLVPTFVYVIFWVGLVPASVVFGDVFRALNPWGAIARAVASIARRVAGDRLPAPLPYPRWLGRGPAVLGVAAFVFLELVAENGSEPGTLATAAVVYSVVTFAAMSFFGIEPWLDRGETFSVLYNLFSRISPFERRDGVVGLRPPLSGLTTLDATPPGTVGLLAVMIGGTTFDGLRGGRFWTSIEAAIVDFLAGRGITSGGAATLAGLVGLAACVLLVVLVYRLGVRGARSVGGGYGETRLAQAFVHSLVPIAVAYVAAHYLTLLLLQGQAIAPLASDPLGRGWDLFGTAAVTVDYASVGTLTTWYSQVGLVVLGHVAAIVAAHDRSLVLYRNPGQATRSQLWMLGVMLAFTTLALWLLSQRGG